MNFSELFKWGGSTATGELPDIYPFPIIEKDFVKVDVINLYRRILIDTLERTDGLPDDKVPLLWDNCLGGESQLGLVSYLAEAMYAKGELFLVYHADVNLVVKATPEEQKQIKEDYKKGESKVGIYITFAKFDTTDLVKLYSALEYCTVGSLYKGMNVSKAIQLKINNLRGSVGLTDKANAVEQAKAIANALKGGKDVLLDAEDMIETAKPDLTATNSALEFIAQKLSFYLGLPASWILGTTSKGVSDTGKSDSKAVERGLKPYYFSIIKPSLEKLLGIKTTFKSDNVDMIDAATTTLQAFESTSEAFINKENKTSIVNKLFGLPPTAKGDEVKNIDLNPPVDPNAPPADPSKDPKAPPAKPEPEKAK